MNLSLQELQKLVVRWDSLSKLQRRSNAVKARIVGVTERAILQVVSKATTAASNTQSSTEQNLAVNKQIADYEA